MLYTAIIISIISICTNIIFTVKEFGSNEGNTFFASKTKNILEDWQKIGTFNYNCDEITEKHLYRLFNYIESLTDNVLVEFSIDNGRSILIFEKEIK